jgi:hypothetical protein
MMHSMKRWFFWTAVLLPMAAFADAVDLEVGETKKVDVGISRGVMCDDLSVIAVDMETDDKSQTNKVVITGLKPGSTLCRAGRIAEGNPQRMLEVTVHEKSKGAPKPAEKKPPGEDKPTPEKSPSEE